MSQSDTVLGRRGHREIQHGRWLAEHETEAVWGWGTPSGRMRAARRASVLAEGAKLSPGAFALEIGCGTGLFTEAFAATGATLVAVDISPELIRLAKRRGLPASRVTFIAKPFEECSVEGPFDSVVGSSVLHHLEIQPALAKIRQLLKPGGWFSFAEPNYFNPQVFLERKLRFLPVFRYTSPDETAFVRWRFAKRLIAAGFADVSIVPLDWLHPRVPSRAAGAIQRIGSVMERIPVLREFAGSLYIRARRPE